MKVGDRVRIVNAHSNSIIPNGAELDVLSFEDYGVDVMFNGGIVALMNEDIELIEERPERYASREVNGMDVLDLINHWNLNFSEGNILKYLLRDKGEDISDFKKIADYANREVKRLEK